MFITANIGKKSDFQILKSLQIQEISGKTANFVVLKIVLH
jgi:hypothetical protein